MAQVQAQAQPTDARGRHGGGAERAQAGERQGAIATGRVIPLYKRVGRAVTRAERNRRPRYRHRRAPRRQMIDKAPVGTAVGMHPPVRPRFGSVWVIHPKFRRAWQAIVCAWTVQKKASFLTVRRTGSSYSNGLGVASLLP